METNDELIRNVLLWKHLTMRKLANKGFWGEMNCGHLFSSAAKNEDSFSKIFISFFKQNIIQCLPGSYSVWPPFSSLPCCLGKLFRKQARQPAQLRAGGVAGASATPSPNNLPCTRTRACTCSPTTSFRGKPSQVAFAVRITSNSWASYSLLMFSSRSHQSASSSPFTLQTS